MALALAVILSLLSVLWLVSLRLRDASIVDCFWGTGFVILAALGCWQHWPPAPRVLLLTALTAVWGLRLSLYLLWRNAGRGEDRRYAAMRAYHGKRFPWVSLFTVFMLQGLILWFVALPVQVAAQRNRHSAWGLLDAAGLALWGAGLCFEALADWQLARFKSQPGNVGRVLDAGLWRYTRHPNYFGDFCVWWGIFCIAAAGGAWMTALSPSLMSLLLMRVSGVTLLEWTIVDRRPDYARYQATTNAFFPGPPRRRANESQAD